MNTQKAKDQLAKIVELFSNSDLPEMISKTYLEPNGQTPSSKWSLSNRMMMMMEGTMDARGYRQWENAGRHVKKGAKAIYILGPNTRKVETDDESKVIVTGFRAIPVFRYEDTDGDPLVTVKDEPTRILPLEQVAKRWGVTVRYDSSNHGEYGSFNRRTNEIRLCTDSVDVFFHELAHKAHSKIEELKPGQDPEQETIAQLTACVLARMYGYDADAFTHNYIAVYAEERTPEAVGRICVKVLGKVEKILELILQEEAIAIPQEVKA